VVASSSVCSQALIEPCLAHPPSTQCFAAVGPGLRCTERRITDGAGGKGRRSGLLPAGELVGGLGER